MSIAGFVCLQQVSWMYVPFSKQTKAMAIKSQSFHRSLIANHITTACFDMSDRASVQCKIFKQTDSLLIMMASMLSMLSCRPESLWCTIRCGAHFQPLRQSLRGAFPGGRGSGCLQSAASEWIWSTRRLWSAVSERLRSTRWLWSAAVSRWLWSAITRRVWAAVSGWLPSAELWGCPGKHFNQNQLCFKPP